MAFGWGIVSTGFHPDNKIAPAINALEGAELAAVYSREQGRAEAFAAKHGVKAAYRDLDALLADPAVDAVFIASPNALHAEQGIRAAQAGKPILCEKPMTTTRADGVALVRACQTAGVKLGVGFELRQNPGHILARDLVAAGALGRVTLAQGQWGFGNRGQEVFPPRAGLRQWWDDPELIGGASTLMGTGVHVIDLLRFMLGQEITEVTALTDGQTAARPLEQMATIALRFAGGALATVICGRLLPDSRNDFALYGVHGRITGRATIWEAQQGRVEVATDTVNRTAVCPGDYLGNFRAMLADFQQAVAENREPAANGQDGLQVVAATLAIIESARDGRAVKVECPSV